MDTSRRSTSPQPATAGASKQDLLWDILIFNSPTRTGQPNQTLFSKDFATSSTTNTTDPATKDNIPLFRPISSSTATHTMAPPSTDSFQTSSTSLTRPLPTPSTVATPAAQQPQFMPAGVSSQFPSGPADPNFMTFNDQNLAAITEFLDQNSGRMFNEWWDFGDL